MAADGFPHRREILEPDDVCLLVPELRDTRNPLVWVHRYIHPDSGWILSIGTHAAPHSGKLSLGGFRIAPAERTESPDYDNDREAIGLAMGMEEKVHWSRVIRAGGPLGLQHLDQLVGGKCVLHPTADARVGSTRDFELLDWALQCFHHFERTAGARLNTGQDLGHGILSDGRTPSLEYLGARFHGCVFADTSKPTGEGNFYVLRGMMDALDWPIAGARIGLIGCGNIGAWILGRLLAAGAQVTGLEANPEKRARLHKEFGVDIRPPAAKAAFLEEPLDAVVVNANGGSLDVATCQRIAANSRIKVVCGSENLTMPEPRGSEILRVAGKVYAPTEFGGMMGYLTAVEEYFARHEGLSFQLETMLDAARRLEEAGREVTRHVRESDFRLSFEDAVAEVYAEPAR